MGTCAKAKETNTDDVDTNDLAIGLLDLLQLPALCISSRNTREEKGGERSAPEDQKGDVDRMWNAPEEGWNPKDPDYCLAEWATALASCACDWHPRCEENEFAQRDLSAPRQQPHPESRQESADCMR